MSKNSVISLFFLFALSVCGLSQTVVPDANFEQALIDLGLDSGPLDGMVPTSNINLLTSLDVSEKNIADLTGIEDFTALTVLDCSINQLTSLNLSQNINLKELYFFNNQIASIDVSMLKDLKILWCQNNLLEIVNITQNPNIISLVCRNNLLKSLDVTKNASLVVLAFEKNDISSIDLTNNPILNRLQCGGNTLTYLDISKNLNIAYISCEENEITAIDTSNNLNLSTLICYSNKLSELDLCKNSSLVVIDCNNNTLCRLHLNNGNNSFAIADFRLNSSLGCVVVDNPLNIPINWEPLNFSGYVSSQNQCANTVKVDNLSDVFTATPYRLQTLINGNYFTQSGGNGTMLNSGDVISISQTIYIYNENFCDSNETSFNVIISEESFYIPKYFTPNNDGNHDVWMVKDLTNNIKDIAIFDPYGKLLKSLGPNVGWNGTFNGKPMETNDYWYVITFQTGEVIKGHFTLKR